jgi:hypothetical protein
MHAAVRLVSAYAWSGLPMSHEMFRMPGCFSSGVGSSLGAITGNPDAEQSVGRDAVSTIPVWL